LLKQIYVVDFVVDQLGMAKPDFDRLFGTEPLVIEPGMAPGVELNAIYYQMPGEGVGIHAVGVFDRSGDGPKEEPTGVILVGILCDDVDTTVAEMRARGVEFLYPEQRRYAVGRNNVTTPIHGVSYSVAQHDEGGYERGKTMMRTAGGSPDYGDPTQGGMLRQLYVIDIVVHDLDAAIESYSAFLGVDPIDTSAVSDPSGEVRSAHFPAPGEGKGIHSVGLFQLTTDTAQTAGGKRLQQALERRGEGVFLIGFLVDDINRAQKELEGRGFSFVDPEPHTYAMGRGNTIANFHGVELWFAEHNGNAYRDYRNLATP